MALALYRKYRPDNFGDVIGQDQVTIPLIRALDNGKLSHAYLFSGPRGCGKTSSARILARCVNCVNGPTAHPCGECESCRELSATGRGSVDVVEIDAASNNGVDQARALSDEIMRGSLGIRDRYKIFIFDEAHMMTQQSFNALLKVVEEPPEQYMFIFATTEPEKVINTIRSRTQHYPFRLVPTEIMQPYLEDICQKEGIEADSSVLRLVMRAGGGSVRDTLTVLDQLMSGAQDGKISYDLTVKLLGFTPETLISQAVDAIVEQNGAGLYSVVEKVVVGGFEPQRFVEDLLSRVRDILIITFSGGRGDFSQITGELGEQAIAEIQRQAGALPLENWSAVADVINTALENMSGAISPRMRLELMVAQVLALREKQSTGNAAGATGVSRETVTAPKPRVGFIGAQRAQQSAQRPVQSVLPASPSHGTSVPAASAAPATPTAVSHPSSTSSAISATAPTPSVAAPAAVPSTAPVSVLSNDEKWAEVLKNLPAEIRVYVDTDKVPQVAFAPKPNGGTHVTLTFDVPMSQHAFALAVSTDSEGNRAKVPVIVQKAVRKVFEPTSTIAPSPQTASGEIVKKVSQLSTEEQAAVKRQIALASSGLNLGTAASLKKPEPKVEPAVPQPASQPAPQPIVQPAPVSDSSVDRKPAPSPESFLSPSLAPTPGPSGHELSESVESASSSESSSSSAGSELDDDDPWADEPDEVSNAAETAETAASAEPSDSAEPKKSLRHIIAGGTPEADGSDRHVDPEDDVYSVTDESLGNSEILSVAELAKRFDVKEIREIPKAEE